MERKKRENIWKVRQSLSETMIAMVIVHLSCTQMLQQAPVVWLRLKPLVNVPYLFLNLVPYKVPALLFRQIIITNIRRMIGRAPNIMKDKINETHYSFDSASILILLALDILTFERFMQVDNMRGVNCCIINLIEPFQQSFEQSHLSNLSSLEFFEPHASNYCQHIKKRTTKINKCAAIKRPRKTNEEPRLMIALVVQQPFIEKKSLSGI